MVYPGHPVASARPVPRTHSDAASTPRCLSQGPELFPACWLVKIELLRASYAAGTHGTAMDEPAARLFAQSHRYDRLCRLCDCLLGGVGTTLSALLPPVSSL